LLPARWQIPSATDCVDLYAVVESLIVGQRVALNQLLQRLAFEVFHGDEGLAVLFAYIVDGADIWVIQCRGGFGFTLKARQSLRIPGHISREKF
jgi:hypothetical protein